MRGYVELRKVFLTERGKMCLPPLLLDEPLVEQDRGGVDSCQELLLRDSSVRRRCFDRELADNGQRVVIVEIFG